jgi:hypothetical protein
VWYELRFAFFFVNADCPPLSQKRVTFNNLGFMRVPSHVWCNKDTFFHNIVSPIRNTASPLPPLRELVLGFPPMDS